MPSDNIKQPSRAGRLINAWTVAAILLVAIILAGGMYIWSQRTPGRALEIVNSPAPGSNGKIIITGEVNNPGLYPLREGDTLTDVLKAAGGLNSRAGLGRLELNVMAAGGDLSQKVDINRAEAWLLAALPGIGEARAQAIIAYRQWNGPFRDINELLKVPGMGEATVARISNLITVGE